MALAMSLGEGQILSRVGEAFSADVALNGSYSKDVSFSQAGNAECRSSVIGNTEDGCASLYSGQLLFSINQRPDGRYFLSVTGKKSNEFFYRVLIKSTSVTEGTMFKMYEFLPEFKQNADEPLVAAAVSSEHDIAKLAAPDVKSASANTDLSKVPEQRHEVIKHKKQGVIKRKHPDMLKNSHAEVSSVKPLQTHLEIKKSVEYTDDIQSLAKENGEIEAQIGLLQKHIGLLKEVIRLKNETGEKPKTPAVQPKVLPIRAEQIDQSGLLTWILLTLVCVFVPLLVWLTQKVKRLSSQYGPAVSTAGKIAIVAGKEKKSLDLTDAFTKPKW